MTDNEEFEEAMGIAEEFDRMTCQEQVRLVLDMLPTRRRKTTWTRFARRSYR